jgi:antitoxin component YwqK of YwqJK toxin-antitoxin module
MVRVEFIDSKADSLFTGFDVETYENGKLKSLSYVKNGVPADTLFYYYENGKIKEKGLLENGFQKGWWIYNREDGSLKEKSEWLTLRDSLY